MTKQTKLPKSRSTSTKNTRKNLVNKGSSQTTQTSSTWQKLAIIRTILIKFILLTLLLIITIGITTAILLPASIIKRYIPEQEYIEIEYLSGTIWHGESSLILLEPQTNLGIVEWTIDPYSLLYGYVDILYNIKEKTHDLSGKLRIHFDQSAEISIQGETKSSLANRFLRLNPLTKQAKIKGLSDIDVQINTKDQKITQWSGNILWNEPQIEYKSFLKVIKFKKTLPTLQLELTTNEIQENHFLLSEKATQTPLILGTLEGSEVKLEILNALPQLVDQQTSALPTQTFMELTQKLF